MKKTIPAIGGILLAMLAGGCAGVGADKLGVRGAPDATPVKPADLSALAIPYERHVLANGLTVIIHEDPKAPIVAVNLWYHVGSKDEKPGKTGFAHLFEHLMFNGSEHFNDEFFRPLEAAGATKMNGTTWNDRTNYYQNVPTPALDLALWLESDRMGHMLGVIDQKRLDEQRGVVQNEKRQRENEPYGKVDELIATSTYPAGHPYSWTTIGSMEDLNAASLEDVKEWFRTYYGAANATLVVAGDVKTADVLRRVEHYFGNIPSGPMLKRPLSNIARMAGERRALLQDRVPQARLFKVWNVPGYTTRDYALLHLAADVLAGGKNSRLYKRLVYEDQLATSASADLGPFELGSQFSVDVMVKAGADIGEVERIVTEEMDRFLRDGPTAEELARIKTRRYASVVRSLERVDGSGGKSAVLAQSQVYGGSPDFYLRRLASQQDATPADVRAAVQRWLSDGVFVLHVEPVPERSVAGQGPDRSRLPVVGEPPALTLPPLQRGTLSNGLRIALAERHNAPVVQMTMIVDAGYAADSAAPGTAKMTLDMLDEGTATRDALGIAARAEALGANLGAGSNQDSSYISLSAIKARLEESVDLYADVLLNPSFPEKELDRLKLLRLAAIQQEKSQPSGLAFRLYRRLLYGDAHAYASPGSGNGFEDVVKAMTVADLRAFYRRWTRPDNAVLLVVGDTTLAEIKPLLEKKLGGWRAPAEPLPVKNLAPVALPAAPRVFLVNRSGSEQSLVLATHVAPPKSDPDDIAMQTANTVLGGLFTSRINMNLREDKHWSYGASSGLVDARAQRPFVAYASVQTDKTAESMRELRRELVEITGKRPLTAAELVQAQKSLVLSLPGDNETTPEIAGSYLNILTYGLADTYYNEFVGKVLGLTPQQASAAARRMVQPQALTWVIVGDVAKIEPQVRKLGFGPVQVLDAEGRVLR